MAVLMVDPPSGWRYGFPAEYDEEKHGSLLNLLQSHGYPEKDIEFALRNMRMWEDSDE